MSNICIEKFVYFFTFTFFLLKKGQTLNDFKYLFLNNFKGRGNIFSFRQHLCQLYAWKEKLGYLWHLHIFYWKKVKPVIAFWTFISNINRKFKIKKNIFILLPIQHVLFQFNFFIVLSKSYLFKNTNYYKRKIVLQLKIANFFVYLKII